MSDVLRIHQFASLQPGPRLIVLGGVHGDELCGTQGIQRMVEELDQGAVSLFGSDTHVHEFVHDARHLLGFPCH